MRYLHFVIGIILIIKGIKEAIALPAAISALQVGSAYTTGEAIGLVIGVLSLLSGGVILLALGWRSSSTASAPAS